MEGAEWSVHKTSIALSKTWNAKAYSTTEAASVWLHDQAAASARALLISVFVENRSVVHIGAADLSQSHDGHFTLLSCNFKPSICVFLSTNVELSVDNSLSVRLLSCNMPMKPYACEAKVVQVPFHAAEHHEIIMSSILPDNSLASASVYVSAGNKIHFTVFYWHSGSISATSMAPLLVDVSQVKAAFLCGRFACVLAANGSIFVQTGSSYVKQSMAAVNAAILSFTNDPRCKQSNGKVTSEAEVHFAVESAWIGDQELVIHWGAGCFTAVEWCAVFFLFCSNMNCLISVEDLLFPTTFQPIIEFIALTLILYAGRIRATSRVALSHHGQLVSALTSSEPPPFHPYQHPSTPWSYPWLLEKPQTLVRLKHPRSQFRS
jgi:hypothetical protein